MKGTPWRAAWMVLLTLALGGCAWRAAQDPAAEAPPKAEAPAPRVVLNTMDVTAEAGGTRLRFGGTGAPGHQVSAVAEPPSAMLDFADVTLVGLPPLVRVADGTVDTVEVSALPGGGGRVTVRLAVASDAAAEPRTDGIDLVLRRRAVGTPPPVAATVAPRRVAERLAEGEGLLVRLGGEPRHLGAFVLSDGKRLVVDAEGVEIPEAQLSQEFEHGPLALVRLGRQEGRVRAVVEARAAGAFEGYRVEKRPEGFAIVLAATAVATVPAPAAVMPAVAPPAPLPAPVPKAEAKADLRGGGSVADLGFRQAAGRTLVELALTKGAPHEVREASGQRVVVDLLRTSLPERFQRALDTSAFPGAVSLVAAYPRGGDTRLVVDLRKPTPFRVERDALAFVLAFDGPEEGLPEPEAGVAAVQRVGAEVVVIEGTPAATPAATPAPQTKPAAEGKGAAVTAAAQAPAPAVSPVSGFGGRRLSMDFVDADIRNVLRLIGDVSGLNVVAGDDVQGRVTVRLVDVPWDQALEVILKTRGLDQVREGNVIRLAPAERLAQEKTRVRELEKAAEVKPALVNDIVPVNYAGAKDLADKAKALLTERGTVTVDDRTNALLVKDEASVLEDVRRLVERLDTQTPQVLIEARIVEVSSNLGRDLGIQWGGRFVADAAHGNATDWAFPHSASVTGSTGSGNYAVDFPAAVGAGAGGALALTLGHVNDIMSLDLRLSAIESSGRGRVVSAPRVTTLNNKPAEISQGFEVPITTTTDSQINVQSIDYKLLLKVTPQVTSDRSIVMNIEVTNDRPNFSVVAADGTPGKTTRGARTEVLVKDGETTVIGGIITDTQEDSESGIPWLSKIPYLGWLFKKKAITTQKNELIIFITPKIVSAGSVARSR